MSSTRVAAAQIRPCWWPMGRLLEVVDGLAECAVSQGVELLALPSGMGWLAIGHAAGLAQSAPVGWSALADACPDGAMASGRWLEFGAEFVSRLTEIVRRHQLWLVAGGIPLAMADGVGNAAVAFSPEGQLVGTQWQTHLSAHQRRLGLAPGQDLSPVDVSCCRLGLMVDDDVLFPEVGRILCLQGATLLVHPSTSSSGSRNALMARLWREVQANQVFGVEAGYTGEGDHGAAVLGPCELTEDRSGILVHCGDVALGIAVADLHWERRREVIEAYPIYASLNSELYERYLPGVYAGTKL